MINGWYDNAPGFSRPVLLLEFAAYLATNNSRLISKLDMSEVLQQAQVQLTTVKLVGCWNININPTESAELT